MCMFETQYNIYLHICIYIQRTYYTYTHIYVYMPSVRLTPPQDDVESVYVQHLEQCSHQEEEIRKQFNTQIRQFEEDKVNIQ